MSKVVVKVPGLGGVRNSKVIEILVKKGQTVEEDQGIITLESDKASMEIPSPHKGVIQAILLSIGDQVNEGDDLIEMEIEHHVDASPDTSEQLQPKQQDAEQPSIHRQDANDIYAGPFVRRVAFEMGIDLQQVVTQDKRGRITVEDLKQYLQGQQISSPKLDLSLLGAYTEKPLSRIQQLSAKHLTHVWSSVPQVTQYHHVDITELDRLRKEIKTQKVTLISFVMKALSILMKRYPMFNSVWHQSDQCIQRHEYHIGFAVDTPEGLVVPVCKDVDQKSIGDIAREIVKLSEQARSGTLDVTDLQSGCATISSLGGIGGGVFAPIVNSPEAFIIGLSRAQDQAIYHGNELKRRLMMPFSISYDHRLIDGAQGARFIVELADLLEKLPAKLPSDVLSYTGIGEENG